MKQSTQLLAMSVVMNAIGILFLWDHWEILAGVFFLIFGNNLMLNGKEMEQDEKYRKTLRDVFQQTQDHNYDVRKRY